MKSIVHADLNGPTVVYVFREVCMRALLGLLVLFGLIFAETNEVRGDDDSVAAPRALDVYEETLNAILRTRLQAEKDYVHRIVALIREGRIPQKVVDDAVLWVRVNRVHSNYGFVYFQNVLAKLGERARVRIPPFDYSIYGSYRLPEAGR